MEDLEIAKELILGLFEHMGVQAKVQGFWREETLYFEIKGDQENVLIGKHGRTLEALQTLITRMVNKRLKSPIRVSLDVDDYRKRRADTMAQMAFNLRERVKSTGRPQTVGPFSAHDRRIIHMTLKEDPFVKTESVGEGELKKIRIIPATKGDGENPKILK